MRLLLALIPVLCTASIMAQSALDQDVLGKYEPLSSTAIAITGPIQITPTTIQFMGNSVQTKRQGKFWRAWGIDTRKRSAIIYALNSDPGKLRQGNRLCGSQNARYAVVWPSYDEFRGGTIEVAIYASDDMPHDSSSPGLCGTFSYALP